MENKFRYFEDGKMWYFDLSDTIAPHASENAMQFVNLTYKYGKEAYQDDLFKSEQYPDLLFRIWKVKGGFAINPPVKIWQHELDREIPFPLQALSDEQTVSWFEGTCTYVGNVYETPDLLKLHTKTA